MSYAVVQTLVFFQISRNQKLCHALTTELFDRKLTQHQLIASIVRDGKLEILRSNI